MMYDFRVLGNQGILIILLTSFLATVSSYSTKDGDVSGNLTADSGVEVWLIAGALAVIFSIVSVILVLKCTDCYNAEVSTESHPACGPSKTMSSENYGGAHSGASQHSYQAPSHNYQAPSHNYGQHVDNSAHLPYALSPHRSQPSAPTITSPPPMGPGGLGGGEWGPPQQPPASGRHYGGPEQPPSYNEAIFTPATR